MRLPLFWEAFWFFALLAAPAVAGLLGRWLGLPSWAVAVSPLFGWAALFGAVRVLVRLGDKRRRSDAESGAKPDHRT